MYVSSYLFLNRNHTEQLFLFLIICLRGGAAEEYGDTKHRHWNHKHGRERATSEVCLCVTHVAQALRRRPRYTHTSPAHMTVTQDLLVTCMIMMASRLETTGWHSNHRNGSSALPGCTTHGLLANFWSSTLFMLMPNCWCNCTCTKPNIATTSRFNYKARLRTSKLGPHSFDDK